MASLHCSSHPVYHPFRIKSGDSHPFYRAWVGEKQEDQFIILFAGIKERYMLADVIEK